MAEQPLCEFTWLELERILSRFYQANTSNEEKKELEAKLNTFRENKFTWQYCLENMNNFENQYLWFFATTTLEETIYKWTSLTKGDAQRMRLGLVRLLSNYSSDTPALQRDKTAQILALVATMLYPEEYPDYFDHIVMLLQDEPLIGLSLARALGDSMTQEKYVLCINQLKDFRDAVMKNVKRLLDILGFCCRYYLSSITTVHIPQDRVPISFGTCDMKHLTTDVLQTLQQYFSWIDLSLVEPELVETLVLLGIWRLYHSDMSIWAISALSELYYRKQPLAFATSNHMMLGIMELLQQPDLQQADEIYQDKLSDLVRLCIGQEMLAQSNLLRDDFFTHLYHFTFETRNPLAFIERLGTWQTMFRTFCDSPVLVGSMRELQIPPEAVVIKVTMATLDRMLFRHNERNQLKQLNDEDLDDNLETELQYYYNRCIELVETGAEMAKQQMYEQVLLPLLKSETSPYRKLMETLAVLCRSTLDMCSGINFDELADLFRDFVPICQIVGRLYSLLWDCVPTIDNEVRSVVMEQAELFLLLSAETAQPTEYLYTRMGPVLSKAMIAAVAQMLTTLRTLLQLIGNGGKSSEMSPPVLPKIMDVAALLMRYLAPVSNTSQDDWKPLPSAAANLLLHVTMGELLSPRTIYQLLHDFNETTGLRHLDHQTAFAVRKTICHSLLAKWHEKPAVSAAGISADSNGGGGDCGSRSVKPDLDANVDERRKLLHRFICQLAEELLRVRPADWYTVPTTERHRIVTAMNVELVQLTDLLTYFRPLGTQAKVMLAVAFREVIEAVLRIYDVTEGNGLAVVDKEQQPMANTLLEFCHSAIASLQAQLGEVFLQQVIQLLLRWARVEAEAKRQMRSLEALLGIFVLIVEQPGNSSLIPDIVQLCVEHVLPAVGYTDGQQKPEHHGELCITLFQLFHAILLHRWRYFVRSQLQQQQREGPAVTNVPQLKAVLNAYGLVITSAVQDAQLIRIVVESLRALHERYRLLVDPFFAENYRESFIQALLELLVSDAGGLFIELLGPVLYECLTADPANFYLLCIRICPSVNQELRDKLCLCTDMPTFLLILNQFVTIARTSVRLFPDPYDQAN